MNKQYRIIYKDKRYIPQVYCEWSLFNWRSITHYGRLRTLTERILGFMEWSIECNTYQDALKSIVLHKEYKGNVVSYIE
jgi:hypothetical protein